MKTIFLLRHAKSSWREPDLDDHDRPLAGRGRRAAKAMGTHLEERAVRPSLILCSSARRTRETLDRLLPHLGPEPQVRIEREIYLASRGELLARLRRVDDCEDSVLLIGHNPGIAELARGLVGDGPAETIQRMNRKFPTAAFAAFALPLHRWQELTLGNTRLTEFTTPRDLSGGRRGDLGQDPGTSTG
jgi:phosphohistidine phosphatase